MKILNTTTRIEYSIEILPIEPEDFRSLGEDRYFFNWEMERTQEIYKLRIVGSKDILGLISLERIHEEWRIHVRLLTVSKENKGSSKQFDKIAGNLLSHAAKLAVMEFGELACVSLRPKTQIAHHYIQKYGMNVTGMTLSIEVPEILTLINTYDHE